MNKRFLYQHWLWLCGVALFLILFSCGFWCYRIIRASNFYPDKPVYIYIDERKDWNELCKYNKFDVVYADFGKNPHGIQGGIRPGIIISCDASNHDGAPQVSVVPLSSKLKDIPVHVILNPKDVSGFGLSKISDFMPEDAQTISKGCIRAKSGTIIEDSGVREEIDRALIRQFDLLPVARKMVMEELANGQQN